MTGQTPLSETVGPRTMGAGSQLLDLLTLAALGLTLALQTAGVFLWAGGVDQRLARLERDMEALPVLLERTSRVEEQVSAARLSLGRIETRLAHGEREDATR